MLCTLICLVTGGTVIYDGIQAYQISSQAKAELAQIKSIKSEIDNELRITGSFPKIIHQNSNDYQIDYTFDPELMNFIKKKLKRYSSDHSVVTVMDNNDGSILAVVGYNRKTRSYDYKLPFTNTHPSASLIKIITGAGVIHNGKISKETVFNYRGKGTTLYKYQLTNKRTRWSRYQSFASAFAISNNVIFGKAAIKNLMPTELFSMASNFGFNKNLFNDISVGKSYFPMPQNQYNMAELASGLNSQTLISPVHAALLSSIIANNGMLQYPRIVNRISNLSDSEDVINYIPESKDVLDERTAMMLKSMMSLTVNRGTAKSSFRKMNRRVRKRLEIGGKTGTITGGIPYGKRDWFTAFAYPKDRSDGKGISISVMNINIDKWYVKSSYLAQEVISYYYKKRLSRKTLAER